MYSRPGSSNPRSSYSSQGSRHSALSAGGFGAYVAATDAQWSTSAAPAKAGADEAPKPKRSECIRFRLLHDYPTDANRPKTKPRPELTFKMYRTECRLCRHVLEQEGFRSTEGHDWNVMWTGSHLKPYMLSGLNEYQRVNHFPRSYEITRKDRLFANFSRMQATHGHKHYNYCPDTYSLPAEYDEFYAAYCKNRHVPWIVKPSASSRGRGIFMLENLYQIPSNEACVVCRYIDNPLLIDGFKFDLRVYVCVTSYDPLKVYIHPEGLTRFATERYQKGGQYLNNQYMHLTNYSINKKNPNFVENEDPDVDNFGNKWSLSALRRFLRQNGVDVEALWIRLHDLIIKTLLSAEPYIHPAVKMFVPYRTNCFEVYGFDILIDDTLHPWLLEVNLSPSLSADTPLDLKIKSQVVSDAFTLIGVRPYDRKKVREMESRRRGNRLLSGQVGYGGSGGSGNSGMGLSAGRGKGGGGGGGGGAAAPNFHDLSAEERRVLRELDDEFDRRGEFMRIYPYSGCGKLEQFFERPRPLNTLSAAYVTSPGYNRLERDRAYDYYDNYKEKQKFGGAGPAGAPEDEEEDFEGSEDEERELMGAEQGQEGYAGAGEAALNADAVQVLDSATGVVRQAVGQRGNRSPPPRPSRQAGEAKDGKVPVQTAPLETLVSPGTQRAVASAAESVNSTIAGGAGALELSAVALTPIQARQAFAVYLGRVQDRLKHEIALFSRESGASKADTVGDNPPPQQLRLDVIEGFVTRACNRLGVSFDSMGVPDQATMVEGEDEGLSKRRILAHKLTQFISIYTAETERLKSRFPKQQATDPASVSEGTFNDMLGQATEYDLEELLSKFTKSVQQGGQSKTGGGGVPSSSAAATAGGGAASQAGGAARPNTTDGTRRSAASSSSQYNSRGAAKGEGAAAAVSFFQNRQGGADGAEYDSPQKDGAAAAAIAWSNQQGGAAGQAERYYDSPSRSRSSAVTGPGGPGGSFTRSSPSRAAAGEAGAGSRLGGSTIDGSHGGVHMAQTGQSTFNANGIVGHSIAPGSQRTPTKMVHHHNEQSYSHVNDHAANIGNNTMQRPSTTGGSGRQSANGGQQMRMSGIAGQGGGAGASKSAVSARLSALKR